MYKSLFSNIMLLTVTLLLFAGCPRRETPDDSDTDQIVESDILNDSEDELYPESDADQHPGNDKADDDLGEADDTDTDFDSDSDFDSEESSENFEITVENSDTDGDEAIRDTVDEDADFDTEMEVEAENETVPDKDFEIETENLLHDLDVDTCLDIFENNDSKNSAVPISVGVYDSLMICPESDEDWFSINLDALSTLTVTIFFTHSSGDLDVVIFSEDDKMLVTGGTVSNNETVTWKAENSGTYYIKVLGVASAQNSYNLKIDISEPMACVNDSYETNGDMSLATDIKFGIIDSLMICSGDEDWFKIELKDEDLLSVSALFSHTLGDIDMRLFRADSSPLKSSVSSDDNESFSWIADSDGVYYISVKGDKITDENSYRLEISVNNQTVCLDDSMENNDSLETSYPVISGSYQGNTLCRTDEDWYSIALNKYETLNIDLYFSHADGDIDLRVVDSAKQVKMASVSKDDNETISWPVSETGTYYIRVYGDLEDVANSYSMNIAVETPSLYCPKDDEFEENDQLSGAKSVSIGTSYDLIVCESDEDWFAVSLESGKTYLFSALFIDSEGDLELKLFSSDGIEVADSRTSNDNESFSYPTGSSGIYYIQVFGFQNASNRYTLEVTEN